MKENHSNLYLFSFKYNNFKVMQLARFSKVMKKKGLKTC